MRLSLAAAGLATSVVLLAGCSNSPQGTLPTGASQGATGASQSATQNVGRGPADFQMLPQVMTREQVAKLHLSVLPKQVLEASLRRHHPIKITLAKSATTPSMVITDYAGYIWWVSKTGAVTGYATDCLGAEGGRIDRKGRLIVSCTSGHTVNIYNSGNTTGPANVVLNDTKGFYPGDAFEDKNGNIFASNLSGFSCTSTCQSYHGDIVWWKTGNQSTGSSPSGSYTDPNFLEDFFADVDANGNVYVDGVVCTFYGYYGCATQGPELDTITNIMGSSPSASNDNIYMNYPGGVYTMGNGQISYDDYGNSAIYLYNSLPGSFASMLNPPQSVATSCSAVSAGYDKGDKNVLVGDSACHTGDLGSVKTNTWSNVSNIDFQTPVIGLFLNSDK
jgi:hypothetical protein